MEAGLSFFYLYIWRFRTTKFMKRSDKNTLFLTAFFGFKYMHRGWWRQQESNPRCKACEKNALTD